MVLETSVFFWCKGRCGQYRLRAGKLHGGGLPHRLPAVLDFLGSLPMLEQIIQMANGSIQPDRWLDGWRRYAVGLTRGPLRHCCLCEATPPATKHRSRRRPPGRVVGVVKSATLGDASVTYDTAAITAALRTRGDLMGGFWHGRLPAWREAM